MKLSTLRISKIITLAFSIMIVSACGGGGGSKSPSIGVPSSSSLASSSSSSSTVTSSSSSVSSSSSSIGSTACLTPAEKGNGGDANIPGFYVLNGKLYDGNDNEFIMRGVNYPYAWFRTQHNTAQKLADIASTCSNTVRVVLSNGEQWTRTSGEEIAAIIAAAKANNLVTMLEIHDSTGYGDVNSNSAPNAANPQTAVDYWLSEDIRAAINGEEGFVLINIANEAFGNFATAQQDRTQWVNFYTGAIQELRTAGLTHTLVVDAPNWGQDWSNSMRDGTSAQTVFDADVNKNVIFSVHMYQVYNTATKVQTYLQAFVDKSLPLIIGEFAADHGEGANNDVAEAAILQYAEEFGFGYLGWSWSGNGSGLGSLDIVRGFNVSTLTPWGETLINGNNGIRATSQMCSCFIND
jgi:mannan endo-1,4-beta-mannosidase